MRHWLEILFAFIACGVHAATPNLPLYIRPDGSASGPSNFFTGSFVAGPNIILTTQRTNLVITATGGGVVVTNIAGGTNISVQYLANTNFIHTTGELNNWSQIPTNTIPSTVAAASNSLYASIIANGSLVSNGCVAFTMTTSNTLASLLVASTNYHNLNGTNFTSKHATVSSNLTVTGYISIGAGTDKEKIFLSTNGPDLYLAFNGEATEENLQVDWGSSVGSGIRTPNVKANYGFFTNSIDVGALTISNNQTNHGGIFFTNVAMPLGGASGITMYQNTNLLVTNGRAWILVNTNGDVGINVKPEAGLHLARNQEIVKITTASGGITYLEINESAGAASFGCSINGSLNTRIGAFGNEVARFLSTGIVGIGTNAPEATLHVTGNNAQKVIQAGTTNKPSLMVLDTNGALYVNPGGGLNPIGCYGSLMMNSTNIVVCAGAAGVYTNVAGTGFTTIVTNGFYGDIVGNSSALTNLVAGWYRVAINISMLGQGNQATEGELFTNGVACDSVGFKKTFDAAARMDSTGANGIIYLPAGTRSDFRIQDAGTGGSISVHRASLVIGTP